MRFFLLLAVAGCIDTYGPSSDGKADENVDGDDVADEGTPASDGYGDTCPEVPDGCVSLAEAVDRGWATVVMDASANMAIENTGGVDICMEGWNTFISDTSQDAAGGNYLSDTVGGADEFGLASNATVSGFPGEWWCVEQPQFTAVATYSFDGAEMAPPITHFIADNTDEDGDGVEDHDDVTLGSSQTNENIWSYEDDNPVIVVGREMNYLAFDVGEEAQVTVRVTNLGRQPGSAVVSERVPAGHIATDFFPAPIGSSFDATDGSATYTFAVDLDAAIDPAVEGDPTTYDVAKITYTLQVEDSGCAGRLTAFQPEAVWTDSAGTEWTSRGAALVLECCNDADGSSNDPWP